MCLAHLILLILFWRSGISGMLPALTFIALSLFSAVTAGYAAILLSRERKAHVSSVMSLVTGMGIFLGTSIIMVIALTA
mgnify:FL=1